MKKSKKIIIVLATVILSLLMNGCGGGNNKNVSNSGNTVKITNVSYDPTRELYTAYNELFTEYYKKETGTEITVIQSHGGSGGQARSVVEGADADVVTLALEHDITLIENTGLIEPGWINEFERDSSPYTSTIVFLVRTGNPKGIQDWNDLIKDGVDVISPDPKSSGAACWNFLAAWHYAEQQYKGNETQIMGFMTKLYGNVLVMDSGARGSTTTFVENGQGDVLVSWENEAISTVSEYPEDYEIVSPSISISAQPSVAIVDENADRNGTQAIAHDYLKYLYSYEAQKLIGEYNYRPSDETILNEYSDKFDLDMTLCTINDFGGWDNAYKKFFIDGGLFDEVYSR